MLAPFPLVIAMPPDSPSSKYRTVQTAAEELKVSVKTLYKWEQDGWVTAPERVEITPGSFLRVYSEEWVQRAPDEVREAKRRNRERRMAARAQAATRSNPRQ